MGDASVGSVRKRSYHQPSHLTTETDPVFETLYSLEYRMIDEDQKPSNTDSVPNLALFLTWYFLAQISFCHAAF
jgi:hypothetical protein